LRGNINSTYSELRGAIREVLLKFAACIYDGKITIAELCQEGISGRKVPLGRLSLAVPGKQKVGAPTPQSLQNRYCAIRGLETCNVELPLFGAFALSKDDQMVGPRQLSHHWCDFLVPVIGSAELPHAEQVRSGATVQSRLCSGVAPTEGALRL
jgi:hypothetical protein